MDDGGPREAVASRSPLQFSMRSMFVATAVVAVLCSLGLATPPAFAAPVFMLLSLALPGLLGVLMVYGRGNWRTFAVAAMFPAGGWAIVACLAPIVFAVDQRDQNLGALAGRLKQMGIGYQLCSAVVILLAMVVGVLGIVVRRAVEAREGAPRR